MKREYISINPFRKFGYWWVRVGREMLGPYSSWDEAMIAAQARVGGH